MLRLPLRQQPHPHVSKSHIIVCQSVVHNQRYRKASPNWWISSKRSWRSDRWEETPVKKHTHAFVFSTPQVAPSVYLSRLIWSPLPPVLSLLSRLSHHDRLAAFVQPCRVHALRAGGGPSHSSLRSRTPQRIFRHCLPMNVSCTLYNGHHLPAESILIHYLR